MLRSFCKLLITSTAFTTAACGLSSSIEAQVMPHQFGSYSPYSAAPLPQRLATPPFPSNIGPISQEEAQLMLKFANTDDTSEREAVEKELHEHLSKSFDKSIERAQLELKQLEARLERAREKMERRIEKKKAIVDSRIKSLLSERDEFAWEYSPNVSNTAPQIVTPGYYFPQYPATILTYPTNTWGPTSDPRHTSPAFLPQSSQPVPVQPQW